MLPLAVLVLGPLAALASPLGGGSPCTWGPAYWCANIPQASECSAVPHCIATAWVPQPAPTDDDEVCTICKEMVGEARDTLMSNETQDELKQVFDGSCDLIPIGLIAKECKALMDQFVPELVETLGSEMNPDTVCTVSGLCNSARVDRLLEDHRAISHSGGDCSLCRAGAASTRLQLERETPDQVEDRLMEVCGYLGSFSTACRMAVSERSKQLYTALALTPWDKGLCDLSGQCSQAFDNVPAAPVPAKVEDLQCEFCEKVIKHWVDVYASNASLAEFKEMLDGICTKLDKNNAEHCRHVVDDYYIPAFEFLRHEVDPHTLCSLAGLCTETPRRQPVMQTALVPAIPALPALTVASSQCEMCRFAATELFAMITDPMDQRMVKNVLESICYSLPDVVERRCEDFVENYTDKILDVLAMMGSPEELCNALDLCTSQLRQLEQEQQMEVLMEQEDDLNQVGDNKCVICEYIVSTLDKMVTDKTSEAEIKAALDSLCSYMPQSVSKQCTGFVDTYTDIIIDMITKDVSPEMICTNLGLCGPGSELVPAPRIMEVETVVLGGPKVGGPYCSLCEMVVQMMDQQIQDKTNEAEVEQALDVLCLGLSTPVHKECLKLVAQYTEELVDMIVHDYPANVICANLGLCVDHQISSNAIPDFRTLEVEVPLGQSVPCEMCEFAVTVIDERLGDTATIDQIEREVQFVCSYMPGTIADKCEELVDKYGEELIAALIKEEMDPQKVCSELLPSCTEELARPPCVWGPEMWCASPFHAKACGATTYCGL